MDNKVFNVVVVPTLVTEASFIGITTLGEDSNFVNVLVEIKDESGQGLFNYVKIDLVCDRCKKLGKESSCTHLMGEIPYWQDAKRHKDIQLMMQCDQDTYMREARYVWRDLLNFSIRIFSRFLILLFIVFVTMEESDPNKPGFTPLSLLEKCFTKTSNENDSGLQSNSLVKAVFDKAALQKLKENVYNKTETVKHIFVSVDPAAGGARSKFAIVSCIYTGDNGSKMVVCVFPPSLLSLSLRDCIALGIKDKKHITKEKVCIAYLPSLFIYIDFFSVTNSSSLFKKVWGSI